MCQESYSLLVVFSITKFASRQLKFSLLTYDYLYQNDQDIYEIHRIFLKKKKCASSGLKSRMIHRLNLPAFIYRDPTMKLDISRRTSLFFFTVVQARFQRIHRVACISCVKPNDTYLFSSVLYTAVACTHTSASVLYIYVYV